MESKLIPILLARLCTNKWGSGHTGRYRAELQKKQTFQKRERSIIVLKYTSWWHNVGLCHRPYACLLGVIRQLTEILISSSDQPCYAGSPNTIRVLDNRLPDIKPPHLTSRLHRPLAEINYWKVSEWWAWLLFCCLPILNRVLQPHCQAPRPSGICVITE